MKGTSSKTQRVVGMSRNLTLREHQNTPIPKPKRLIAHEIYVQMKRPNASSTAWMERSRNPMAMEEIPFHQKTRNNSNLAPNNSQEKW